MYMVSHKAIDLKKYCVLYIVLVILNRICDYILMNTIPSDDEGPYFRHKILGNLLRTFNKIQV